MLEGLAVVDLSLFGSTEEPVAGLAEETRLWHQQVQTCVKERVQPICQRTGHTSGGLVLDEDVGCLTDGFARVVGGQGAGGSLCRGLLLLLRRLPHCV